jgi:hypothetical protein
VRRTRIVDRTIGNDFDWEDTHQTLVNVPVMRLSRVVMPGTA